MQKKLLDTRREEIIDACEKLYKEVGFKNVNIKLIGENISCSRTSIYNYFETKEEIFLALVEREYLIWNKDLKKFYEKDNKVTLDEFINNIVSSLSKRRVLLKLISMNMYEMEENSSYESVKSYKTAYTESVNLFKNCLIKLLNFNEEEATNKVFTFFPFMIGIYPYSAVTKKQKKALTELDFKYNYYNIEDLIKMGLKNILGGI
jgi:AcrR family transcriptional regulator